MRPLGWEKQERLALGQHPPRQPVTDDLTEVIAVLAKMLTDYHETRPRKPLTRRRP